MAQARWTPHITARLFRESPINAIWEGSGNVQCLDILRALQKEPEVLAAYFTEVERAQGADKRLDASIQELKRQFAAGGDAETLQYRARSMADQMALTLQAALLVQHAPSAVADAFCAGRLGGQEGLNYGTLPRGVDTKNNYRARSAKRIIEDNNNRRGRMNIPNYVARNARKYTRHEAVVAYEPTGVSRHSWGELNIHVNQFAHYLQQEHGIEDGDRVALFLPNTYAFVVAHFRCATPWCDRRTGECPSSNARISVYPREQWRSFSGDLQIDRCSSETITRERGASTLAR